MACFWLVLQPKRAFCAIKTAIRSAMIGGKGNVMKVHEDEFGFTLIEMMAAIGVAGILMAIAIPFFTKTLPGLRLTDATRQVATDLQQVRMRAIAQSIPHQISFSTTTYIIQSCNGSCVNVGGNVALPEGISVTPPSTAPQFQPRGTVTAAATIKLSNGTTNKWVCVKIIGRVNVQDTVCT
jgi:prepilin-type N-terminal cleavage/methylation domain-containing protein